MNNTYKLILVLLTTLIQPPNNKKTLKNKFRNQFSTTLAKLNY